VPPIAAPIATPATTNQPSTLSTPHSTSPTLRESPCPVCEGNFKDTALQVHLPKCQAWAAKAAPRQYTSTVNGRLAISYPLSYAFSRSENGPVPKWLVIAKQKVDPIRHAQGDKMQAEHMARLVARAAELDRETAKIEKEAAEAEKAAEAEEAKKQQPAKKS
jgi:hypothetical protein